MDGWIKLHRKISEKAFYKKDSEKVHLWIHLLLKAANNEKEELLAGKYIKCNPGQFTTGRRQLSEETGIHESKVERILTYFEKIEHQIEQQKTTTNRLITIVNWKEYQFIEHHSEQRLNNDRTTTEQRLNTLEERKNIKKGKNINIDRCSFVSDTFLPVWNDWLAWKNTIKHQYKTSEGAKRAYDKLLSLSNNDPLKAAEIIQNCIANEWKGIYPMREAVIKNMSHKINPDREKMFKRFTEELYNDVK